MMRNFWRMILVAAFAAGAVAVAVRAADSRPNVLVIFIDDMGYGDPSCFGNEMIETPNIDRLAREGLRFTNFYVNSPICSASRVALGTGQYQQRWRIQSFLASRQANHRRRMADWLDPAAIHTAQVFKDAGYRTAHFGKWHMGGGRDVGDAPLPTEYGFDETLVSFEGLGDRVLFENEPAASASEKLGRGKIEHAPKREMTRIYVDHAIEFLDTMDGAPFYLEVFPNDVHDAFLPLPEDAARFASLTDNPEEQKFFAVLEELDRQIGRLLDHLDRAGLSEETIVVFTSDNGPTDWPRYYQRGIEPPGSTGPFFGRKWSLFEGGIRMPFIIRWPGHIPAGKVDETTILVAMDMQPSLCVLAGISTPAGKRYDGLDMSRALLGHPIERSTAVFWEYGAFGSIVPGKKEHISPTLAMRHGDWKFLVNIDGSNAMLFDLEKDPGERVNLAPEKPEMTARFQSRTLAWWNDVSRAYEDTP